MGAGSLSHPPVLDRIIGEAQQCDHAPEAIWLDTGQENLHLLAQVLSMVDNFHV